MTEQINHDLAEILETLEGLVRNIDDHREKDIERQNVLQATVRDLYLIVVGHDGRNGLRSRIQELEKKHEGVNPQALKAEIDNQERWRYQTMAIIAFVQLFLVPIAIALFLKFLS